jgi:signal transduction histidine kinase
MFDFLKQVPLFNGLSTEDLMFLCGMISQLRIGKGEQLFNEGDDGKEAYVIKEGQIQIYKTVAGREVHLALRGPGEVIGEVSLLEAVPRTASGRAQEDSLLFVITHEQLDKLLSASPSAAITMLHTVTSRLKSSEQMLQQSEKLAQLGMLTAGIAHEINNPVAAVQRAASQLKSSLVRLQQAHLHPGLLSLSEEQWSKLSAWTPDSSQQTSKEEKWDLLWVDDLETELADWLEEKGFEDAWDLAPELVKLRITVDKLDEMQTTFTMTQFKAALAWLAAKAEANAIIEEIHIGAGRVADIVKALKSYVYLDQGPSQRVDVHEGLENTLVILRSKFGQGIKLRRDYARDLPEIEAYGSELNQVWTNIIANACEAMGDSGELVLRTRGEDGWVVVEIQDNGPGIPEDIRENIFNPFFTTKPVGQGTGLGLSISYNIVQKHGGEIRVFSQPGQTCFQVLLPTYQEGNGKASLPLANIPTPS